MNRAPLYNGLVSSAPVGQRRPNSGWTHQHSVALRTLALFIPAVIVIFHDIYRLPVLLLTILVCWFWHYLFARSRQQLPGLDLLVTALLFVVMLPPGYSVAQLLMAVSFGVVLGEQVFGGRGYAFTHPAIVALAFLLYSFPTGGVSYDTAWLTLSFIPGLLLLLYYQLIDYRVLIAILLGSLAVLLLTGVGLMQIRPASVVIAGMFFAVTDPGVGSLTRFGNSLYGLLAGLLVAILDPTLTSVKAVVFASLLASTSAPMIDWCVERINRFMRRRSHA